MKYAYYPGCSAESTASDMHQSTLAVARALGIDLVEPKGWTCCGATAGHQTDRLLAVSLPAANLTKVQDMKLDMMVNCAACYNRMKVANHEISSHPAIRKGVRDALDRDYDGSVKVHHLVEVLLQDVGLPTITKSLKRSLNGLKVACYYGCLLVRPPEIRSRSTSWLPRWAARASTGLARSNVAAAVCRCRGRTWWSSLAKGLLKWPAHRARIASPSVVPCARSTSIYGNRTSTSRPERIIKSRLFISPSFSGFAWASAPANSGSTS